MRKLLLLGVALLAAYLAGRAVKRNAEVITLLCVLTGLSATASLANTPKTRAVEDRLNALVPAVGAVTATANAAQATASSAQATADNSLPLTGGTVNGNVTVNGAHTVNGQVNAQAISASGAGTTYGFTSHGDVAADGNVYVGGAIAGSGGGALENSSGIHTSGNLQADGQVATTDLYVSGQRVAPGQGTPGGYPAVGSPSNAGLGNLCNEIIVGLQAAGIFS